MKGLQFNRLGMLAPSNRTEALGLLDEVISELHYLRETFETVWAKCASEQLEEANAH